MRRGTARQRLRRAWRNRGLPGLFQIAASRIRTACAAALRRQTLAQRTPRHSIPVLHFRDFHDEACLTAIDGLAIDLFVVSGTYILRPPVFERPRLGSINLHCGRVPDFRGSPPAFWELYEGVPEVGVTVHRVSARLDEGAVLMEDRFPLDIAPPGDPVQHAQHVWRTVLFPAGLRMLARVVSRFAHGGLTEKPQPPGDRPPYRTPTRAQVRELRRRVRSRRTASAHVPS
jgi:methionyl-tRNA formyltransferase